MARSEETLTTAVERPAAAAAAEGAEELPAGARVGGYVIEDAAARGGFATVYRARSLATGEDVAIKVLHPDVALSGVAVRRLRQEAEALGRVAHPNIVQTFEVGELRPDQPYLVMEWLRGHTLTEELKRRGTFAPAELLGVMEQLCAGLGAAHEAGIVHRDLKASNVMVLPRGGWFALKLVDFGIAKLIEEPSPARHSLTTSGVTLGTPHYMAPEQVLGQAVDARADIYALGVLSYLLLTGRFPFHALNSVEILEMHLYGPPPRVGDVVPVPAGVDAVIKRCLEKRREQRYASAAELLDELRRAARKAEGPASSAGQVGSGPRSAAPRTVAGVYVAVSFDGPDEDIDDDALGAMEEALAGAREDCEAEGLRVVFESGSAWLAVCSAADADAAARAELVELALGLRDRWVGCHPGVRVAISVHAEVARSPLDDGATLSEGETFRPGAWTSAVRWDAVVVSGEALAGAEDRFDVAESEGSTRFLVRGRRGGAGEGLAGG